MLATVLIAITSMLPAVAGAAATEARGQQQPSEGTGAAGPPVEALFLEEATFAEGFADITTLAGDGWHLQNNSNPLGTTGWFQGNPNVFPAQEGDDDGYIAANFNNTAGTAGTISNWLVTPAFTLKSGDTIAFWTRTVPPLAQNADRLEVRLSLGGGPPNVGQGAFEVGAFTTVLLTINPDLVVEDYPDVWTRYLLELEAVPLPTAGRFAFRYFVTEAGPGAPKSDFIGIDAFSYLSAATLAVSSLAGAAVTLEPGESGAEVVRLALAANLDRATEVDAVTLAFGNPLAPGAGSLSWSSVLDPASLTAWVGVGEPGDEVPASVTTDGSEATLTFDEALAVPAGGSVNLFITADVRSGPGAAASAGPGLALGGGLLAGIGLLLRLRRRSAVAASALAFALTFTLVLGACSGPPRTGSVEFTAQAGAIDSDASLTFGVPTPPRTFSVTY